MKRSISELGVLTGFDRRRIKAALADLKPTKGTRGAVMYESTEALPRLYLGDGSSAMDSNKERARLTHHQANLAELDERQRRDDLVLRDDVVEEITGVMANMRAKLLSIPVKTSAVLIGMDDLYEVQAVLESAVHEALEELHNQYVDNGKGGEGVEAAAPADG